MRSHFYLFSLVIYFLSCLFNSSLGTDVNDTFLEDSSEESLQFQKLIEFVHNNSAFHIIERFFNLLSEPDFEKVINSTDVSQLCYNDLRLIGNGISTGESWALRRKFTLSVFRLIKCLNMRHIFLNCRQQLLS